MKYLLIYFFIIIFPCSLAAQSNSGVGEEDRLNYEMSDSLYQVAAKKVNRFEGQDQLSLFVGGGLSTFKFTPSVGELSGRTGFMIGMDYTYYWHPKWGINVGLVIDQYKLTIDYHSDSISYESIDVDGDDFTYIANFNELQETQTSWLLGVPLQLRFRQELSQKFSLLAGFGVKSSFALSSHSKVKSGSFSSKGYYPQYGSGTVVYPGDGPGFDYYSPRETVSPTLGIGISGIGDLLLAYRLSPIYSLYAGVYAEYQLNKCNYIESQPIVSYTVYSPTLAESKYNGGVTENAPSGAHKVALGAKIGLIYDLGGAKIVKQIKKDRIDAQEALRQAELRRMAYEDSLDNARLLALRQKAFADSLARAEAEAAEALRIAALLAEKRRIEDSIANANSKNIAVVMDIRTNKLSEDELAILKLPIIFNFGSAELSNQSKVNAQKIGLVLAAHAELEIVITGHTCDIGNDQNNYQLGLKRANSLNREFAKSGVLPSQVTTSSKGESEPLLPNVNEENRRRNRRVVCLIKD